LHLLALALILGRHFPGEIETGFESSASGADDNRFVSNVFIGFHLSANNCANRIRPELSYPSPTRQPEILDALESRASPKPRAGSLL
jgi:hypothetical protein